MAAHLMLDSLTRTLVRQILMKFTYSLGWFYGIKKINPAVRVMLPIRSEPTLTLRVSILRQ